MALAARLRETESMRTGGRRGVCAQGCDTTGTPCQSAKSPAWTPASALSVLDYEEGHDRSHHQHRKEGRQQSASQTKTTNAAFSVVVPTWP